MAGPQSYKMGCCCEKEQIVKNAEPLVAKVEDTVSLTDILSRTDLDQVSKREVLQGRYVARLSDLYDGDTMTVVLSHDGGKTLESLVVRVMGMDCPELKGITKEAGIAAKHEALRFLGASGAIGLPARAKTRKWFNDNPTMIEIEFVPIKEKWGRYLANVCNSKGEKLGDHLIGKGLAKAYDGGKKDQQEWEE
jgi:endonuclease YncB( thermonuclease family)